MGTSYSNVRDRFYRKIKEDKSFFTYNALSLEEKEEIIKKRANFLMDDAVMEFQLLASPQHDITFFNKDDENEMFNFDLTLIEEDLISDLMIIKHYQEQLSAVNKRHEYVDNNGKLINTLKGERETLIQLSNHMRSNFDFKLDEYNSRDRMSNTYFTFNELGAYVGEEDDW